MSKTLEIPAMPDLWLSKKVLVSHKYLAGALAKWAIVQSPDVAPESLSVAIKQFMRAWPHDDYHEMTSEDLRKAVEANFANCPLIKEWNKWRTNDRDFISLGALADNVSKDLTLWDTVERAQNKFRDAE